MTTHALLIDRCSNTAPRVLRVGHYGHCFSKGTQALCLWVGTSAVFVGWLYLKAARAPCSPKAGMLIHPLRVLSSLTWTAHLASEPCTTLVLPALQPRPCLC